MMQERDIDELFALARADAPEASAAFLARVIADADALMPQPMRRPRPPRFWSGLLAGLGGGGALAGLVTATMAGVLIGLAPPASLEDMASTLWSQDTDNDSGLEVEAVDPSWDLAAFLDEG